MKIFILSTAEGTTLMLQRPDGQLCALETVNLPASVISEGIQAMMSGIGVEYVAETCPALKERGA